MNSHYPLKMCSPVATCQIKKKNLTIKNSYQWGSHVRSLDKLSTLYLNLQKIPGDQTRQVADLQWEGLIFKAARLFYNKANVWKNCISTITRRMVSKPARVLTYEGEDSASKRLSRHGLLIFLLFLHPSALFGQTGKRFFIFFSNCYFKRVWSGLELLIWYSVCFQVKSFRDNQ